LLDPKYFKRLEVNDLNAKDILLPDCKLCSKTLLIEKNEYSFY
jgi:hypothetical protein